MNYLAHIYLARHSDLAMLGGLMGDFTKPSTMGVYPAELELEITIHRKIDSFTDSHPVTRDLKTRFHPERRRFAGILLDVFYDHFLVQRWSEFSAQPLQPFIDQFYRALTTYPQFLPEVLSAVAPRMISQNWLGCYHDIPNLELTLRRISGRLSKHSDLFQAGIHDLSENYESFAAGFDAFFPELESYVSQIRASMLACHD